MRYRLVAYLLGDEAMTVLTKEQLEAIRNKLRLRREAGHAIYDDDQTIIDLLAEVDRLLAAITEASRQFHDEYTTTDEIHRGLRAALEQKP
jgi:hypothetical protein